MTRFAWIIGCSLGCLVTACGDDTAEDPPKDSPKDAGAPDDAGSDAGPKPIDRSELTDVGTSGRLDYSKPEYWVCRPGLSPNECERELDATEIAPDGTLTVIEHEPAEEPAFDCFYVYPTIWLDKTPNMTDFSDEGVRFVLDPLLSQAARFGKLCRLYAPLYRQVGLSAGAPTPGHDKQLALQDVRDAFAHYLEHDAGDRKFVLLGHSQGTFMLASMMARDIDEKPELRERLISAVLLGGQPYTPPGERLGGSFKNIPPCSEPGETGCVIAFNSFAEESPPRDNTVFGRVGTELANEEVDLSGQVMCVNPASLLEDGGRFSSSYFALSLQNPSFGEPVRPAGVETPFTVYRDLFRGSCKYENGISYLEISVERPDGDTRELPDYRNPLLDNIGFGLHLVDYSIPLGDLIAAVELQAAAALK